MKINKDLNGKTAEFLTNYMKARGLTQSSMSSLLGYKSITSLVRLLKGRVAYIAVQDCLERLAALPKTAEEEEAYRKLTESDIALIKHEVWLSILNEKKFDPEATIMVNGTKKCISERFEGIEGIKIRMYGCVTPAMTAELVRMIERGAEVKHFIRVEDQGRSLTDILDAMLTLHYHPNYHAVMYDAGTNETISGVTGSDIMMISYKDSRGRKRNEMLILKDPENAIAIAMDGKSDINQLFEQAYGKRKTAIFSNNQTENHKNDVESYLKYLLIKETDCEIRSIRPDMGIDMIPAEMLSAHVNEAAIRAYDPNYDAPTVRALTEQRWANAKNSKRLRQIVTKRSTMEAFFKTGMPAYHHGMLRAFTKEERRAILDELIAMQLAERGSKIYFLKDDTLLPDREATLYGRNGLRIMQGNSEITIARKRAMDSFTAFFDEALIGRSTLSVEDSTEVLRSFYELLEACE